MSPNEFSRQQQDAINRMREMNKKSTNPQPDNTRRPPPKPQPKQQNSQDGLELPFGNLFKDKDTALILGLLLILYGEKADKMLLLALVYILL